MWILALALIAVLAYFINKNYEPSYSKDFRKYFGNTLDIKPNKGIVEELSNKLNMSLNPDYMENVNTKFRMKFPHCSQKEINELWRELKRFFIMAAVFNKVEMFNDKVDELWHIMLEYEDEYKSFCLDFIGSDIKHKPHSAKLFKPDERTFFDFCYVQLFKLDYISVKVWGEFFQNGKGEHYLDSFLEWDNERLRKEYSLLNASAISLVTFDHFEEKVKNHKNEKSKEWKQKYKSSEDASFGYYAFVANDDEHRNFNDMMGISSKGNHDNHYDYNDVNGGGGDHSSSSCSSCSSCSSS